MNDDVHHNVLFEFFNLPETQPNTVALVTESGWLTYREMRDRIGKIQLWLTAQHLVAGDRVVLAVPPSIELYTLLSALIGLNITATFIDPGFTPKQMAHCIGISGAKMVIGRRKAGVLKILFPSCRTLPFFGTDGGFWPIVKPWTLPTEEGHTPTLAPVAPDDHCIITFTSGTTGPSKAADRTHGLIRRQLAAIVKRESSTPPSVWMSTFPVTALYCFSRGVTFCFPNVNLRQQRWADPDTILGQLTQWNVDGITASPAFFHALASQSHTYPTVREVFVGGACVSLKLVKKLQRIFPTLERLVIVYGSTEIEPVCLQNGLILLDRNDLGANVGPVLPEINFYLVDTDRLNQAIDLGLGIDISNYAVPVGTVGELVLIAPHLMDRYLDSDSNKSVKLTDSAGICWHRMGDMAYINTYQELVLVGRSKDRIQFAGKTYHPFPVELALANLTGIHMAALIDTPSNGPTIVLEPEASAAFSHTDIAETLRQFSLAEISVRTISEMPVDVRHNSRLDRVRLAQQISTTKLVDFERILP